jgi:hypothetical protein
MITGQICTCVAVAGTFRKNYYLVSGRFLCCFETFSNGQTHFKRDALLREQSEYTWESFSLWVFFITESLC